MSCLEDYKIILKDILENERIKKLWDKYKSKRAYVKNIEIVDIIEKIELFLDEHNIIGNNKIINV